MQGYMINVTTFSFVFLILLLFPFNLSTISSPSMWDGVKIAKYDTAGDNKFGRSHKKSALTQK